jgi:hypothetical protein
VKALYFDVNRVPLVAITGDSMHMRRYVGRECTHEAELAGLENASPRDVRDAIELFREDPVRALRQHAPAPEIEQPIPA